MDNSTLSETTENFSDTGSQSAAAEEYCLKTFTRRFVCWRNQLN
jgi:hypothetical protein